MSTDTDPRLQWSAEYGPTAKEIDEQRAVLKAAYAESIGKLVDSLADCEHRIAQYEMEFASIRDAQGKPLGSIERYTTAHFQTAARALVAMFMQSDPPNYLKMPVLVDDDLRLIITVKREGAKSPQSLLVEKTEECERLRAGLEAILDRVGRDAPRGGGASCDTTNTMALASNVRGLAKRALKAATV